MLLGFIEIILLGIREFKIKGIIYYILLYRKMLIKTILIEK